MKAHGDGRERLELGSDHSPRLLQEASDFFQGAPNVLSDCLKSVASMC